MDLLEIIDRDDYRRLAWYNDYGRDSKRATYDSGSSRPECNFIDVYFDYQTINRWGGSDGGCGGDGENVVVVIVVVVMVVVVVVVMW